MNYLVNRCLFLPHPAPIALGIEKCDTLIIIGHLSLWLKVILVIYSLQNCNVLFCVSVSLNPSLVSATEGSKWLSRVF